mmetsp:Transcript_30209/g.76314  ORF Transcript_30209/g.76314 Transcript_30209/m.76314 type:complete len:203 (-) Transcript_30209:28-636(-)
MLYSSGEHKQQLLRCRLQCPSASAICRGVDWPDDAAVQPHLPVHGLQGDRCSRRHLRGQDTVHEDVAVNHTGAHAIEGGGLHAGPRSATALSWPLLLRRGAISRALRRDVGGRGRRRALGLLLLLQHASLHLREVVLHPLRVLLHLLLHAFHVLLHLPTHRHHAVLHGAHPLKSKACGLPLALSHHCPYVTGARSGAEVHET